MPAGEYCYAGLRPDPRFIALLFRGSSTGIIGGSNSKERYRIASPHQRPAGAQVAPLRCLILHCWHVYSNMGVALIQELCKDFPVLLPVMVFQSNLGVRTESWTGICLPGSVMVPSQAFAYNPEDLILQATS